MRAAVILTEDTGLMPLDCCSGQAATQIGGVDPALVTLFQVLPFPRLALHPRFAVLTPTQMRAAYAVVSLLWYLPGWQLKSSA
jgi:hypothetical protein